ncbi:hypothetical protein VOLCADRAFT_92640 [Volvox carteri f. nagariensis]|uniref:acyl-CoA oxidase n=1 Tax=Volvox carteri f. nagariensis TaxID=3068 RepID=D8U064_VOLCA|nr:uncharacterized protein VOLCADRAFT_92640 [Volvox carteri f. nagariensis]EFJ46884.1 hypothetical protein VOLCADRAFT_92640 [Volvox carteri f. nagariensis]|eukprot:XP_002952093.1 hypothetical protein VOLCADRAFT_92640 [Volvox carteri f. nagariensis]
MDMVDHVVDERTKELQRPATNIILRTHTEPSKDLEEERRKATFNVQELAYVLNGGKELLEKKQRFAEILSKTPWGDKSRRYFLGREEEYVGGLRAALGIWEKMKTEGLGLDDGALMRTLVDFPGGLELHIGMFIPSILSQGSPEQQAKWMPLCMGLRLGIHNRIIGTYAQTELGHGTFVRGLETTATYDRQVTPEGRYVPPPPSNSKASYATMVFVRADIVKNAGSSLGRAVTIATRYAAVRRQTAPAPGERELQVYNTSKGNVTRRRVCMRVCMSRGVEVLDYQNCSATLLPLIASSYALYFMGESMMAMYRQFERDRDRGEFGALPELHALSSGLKVWGGWLDVWALCTWITADGIEECRRTCGGHGYSKLSGLPTLFQNYVQNVTWEGDNNVLCLQTARYLLKDAKGPVGRELLTYWRFTFRKRTQTHFAPSLLPVTARILSTYIHTHVQALAGVHKGTSASGSASYLNEVARELAPASRCTAACDECWLSPEVAAGALRHAAARSVAAAAATLTSATGGKLVFEGRPWNENTVDSIRAAKAHCTFILHQTFIKSIEQLEEAAASTSATTPGQAVGSSTAAVLRQLAALFALEQLEREGGVAALLEDGYLSAAQAASLRRRHRLLLTALRPNAVALVDAFAFPDYLLNSALGRADGDVYRGLLDMAPADATTATTSFVMTRSEKLICFRPAGQHLHCRYKLLQGMSAAGPHLAGCVTRRGGDSDTCLLCVWVLWEAGSVLGEGPELGAFEIRDLAATGTHPLEELVVAVEVLASRADAAVEVVWETLQSLLSSDPWVREAPELGGVATK